MKRYTLVLLGLILFSSGLCVFGEALISKYENNNWFFIGTISLILINAGLGLMIKNKWGTFLYLLLCVIIQIYSCFSLVLNFGLLFYLFLAF